MGCGASGVQAGFDAFEEPGVEERFDGSLDRLGIEALATFLEVLFCQALFAGQQDGSQHLRLCLPILATVPSRHSDETSKIRTYVRIKFGSDHAQAAAHAERLPGHESGVVGGQEGDRGGHLEGLSQAPELGL